MPVKKYSKEKLLEMYINSCCAQGKILSSTEIDKTNKLPEFSTFSNYFNGIGELRKLADFDEVFEQKSKQLKLKERLKETFCKDCILNSDKCNKEPEQCLKEADEIYFESRGVSNFEGLGG